MFTQEQIERANVIISRCLPGARPLAVIPQMATDGTLLRCLTSADLTYMLAAVEDEDGEPGFAIYHTEDDINPGNAYNDYGNYSQFDQAFKRLLQLEFEERAEQAQFEYDALTVRATAG